MRIQHPCRALLLVGWMGLIFALSAQPDSGTQSGALLRLLLGPLADGITADQLETLHHGVRKVAHFTEYAVLALLWAWNLGTAPGRLAWSWALTTLYAASDEWHQAFVPNRGPSPWDVVVDSTGALAMLTIIRYWLCGRSWLCGRNWLYGRWHGGERRDRVSRSGPGPALPGPVSGVPSEHSAADLPGMLGGDPAGRPPHE